MYRIQLTGNFSQWSELIIGFLEHCQLSSHFYSSSAEQNELFVITAVKDILSTHITVFRYIFVFKVVINKKMH